MNLQTELKRVLSYEYKTVDVSTPKGLKLAEKLHNSGWKIIHSGLFTITFERNK